MKRTVATLALSATLLVAWLSLLPSQASARVDGGCTATIDGVDVTTGHDQPSTAVPMGSAEQIPVTGTSPSRVVDLSYTVRVVGAGVQVGNVTVSDDGLSWSGTVDLREFSAATVGLFEVRVDVRTETGSCTGVVYVCIEGRGPLTTAAGAGAAALTAGGILLLGLSLAGAGRMNAGRAGVQGFAGGAAAGLGAAVLLQQFCTLPLTATSAAGFPLSLGAAGAFSTSFMRAAGRRRRGRAAPPPPSRPERTRRTPETVGPGVEVRELADAGQGAGGQPQARGGGGPSPTGPPGGGGGGPSPTGPSGGGGGGPSPTGPPGGGGGGPSPTGPPGGGGGGPSPTGPPGGGAPEPPELGPAEGGVVVPPVIPPRSGDEGECPACGWQNTPDSLFCTNCGTRLPS